MDRKEKIRRWILSLVSVVVISVLADVNACSHGILALTPFPILILVIQVLIALALVVAIARGIAADRGDRGQ